MKKLPIGIHTFSELIEDQHYYVDKTQLIAELVATGKYYFLARPRRFGKSLLISTLKSAFRGEQALFNGLYLQGGYTLAEIKAVFNGHLDGVDFELLAQWYNGYNFLGEKVYNSFDVLLYLDQRLFKNYWFETGSPSFLIKLVRERQYLIPDFENVVIDEAMLASFDVDEITLENVLFQTGYLTIDRVEELGGDRFYYPTYPNREVKASLNSYLLRNLTQSVASERTNRQSNSA